MNVWFSANLKPLFSTTAAMMSEITGGIDQAPSAYWCPASLDNIDYARVCLPQIAFQQSSSGNGSAFGGKIVVDNGRREIHRRAIQELGNILRCPFESPTLVEHPQRSRPSPIPFSFDTPFTKNEHIHLYTETDA